MKASRLVLENKKEESLAVVESFLDMHFDPEGLYFIARVMARVNEPDTCLDMLDRIIERGFYCSSIMLKDPWLDSIRGQARFGAIVSRADARSREAEAEFRRLNGDRLLGMAI
jgi:hypothetical protein